MEVVTILETICTDGTAEKPMIIFKGQNLMANWFSGDLPTDWEYTTSPNGSTSDRIARACLRQLLVSVHDLVKKQEVVFFDGHHCHIHWTFLEACLAMHIIPCCLPPKTTYRIRGILTI